METTLRKLCADPSRFRSKITLDAVYSNVDGRFQISIWVDETESKHTHGIEEVAQACDALVAASGNGSRRQAWVFNCSVTKEPAAYGNFILVAEIGESHEQNGSYFFTGKFPWASWTQKFLYKPLKSRCGGQHPTKPRTGLRHRSVATTAFALLMAFATILAFSALFEPRFQATEALRGWSEDGYIRYLTPGSEGPKRQARIYYYNATEWSQNNPHDNGQWKIRMDDQALIPTEAWDEDEDKYQEWYHARYPEMRDVIRSRKFLRPSWLGSLDILVPWDKEFHLAHCVLTMRRYWKAKETGKHVCSRDIDHNHIQHCLNWFDGMVFADDASGVPEMGTHMIWQTKVCY